MPNQKPSVADRIIKGLNTTASVIGAATSLGKTAYAAAKFAAPIVKAIIRMIGNPKSWYLKYGPVTPAANENRPMEPIFNTLLTKNATFGVPHFVDVEVAWTDFADTYMMDQVVTNAMRSIRKHLRSNLPYDEKLIKAYLVNAVALCVMAKQVERDVHWAQYTATNNPRWQAMFIKKARTVGSAGIVELIDEEYLSDENWAYTSSIYNKFKDLYNNTVFGPAALGEFISHYFGSLFVSSTDGHNDQYIRLKMQEIDWMELVDGEWTTTKLNVSNLTLDDVMKMLNVFSKQFAIVIADLEKAVSLSATAISSYEEYAYYLVYDESLLQALINGYTSTSGLTNKDYVRLDRMPGVDDDLTQFLFMGALQPEDSSLSNTKALRILSMTYKLDSNDELEWPAEFSDTIIREDTEPVKTHVEPFGLQIVSDIVSQHTTNVTIAREDEPSIIILDDNTTPVLAASALSIYLSTSRGRTINSGTFTKVKTDGKIITADNAAAYWYIPQAAISVGNNCVFVAVVIAKAIASNAGHLGDETFEIAAEDARIVVYTVDGELDYALGRFKGMPASGVCGVCPNDESTVFASVALHAIAAPGDGIGNMYAVTTLLGSTGYLATGYVGARKLWWTMSFSINCRVAVVDSAILADQSITPAGVAYKAYYHDGVIGTYWSAVEGTVSTEFVSTSIATSLAPLAAYAADVFDYHIPFVIKTKYAVNVDGQADLEFNSDPVLVKENYIPYFYNVLDLIPVLYSMFTSLFSFEGKRNDWGTRDTAKRKERKPKDK